MTEPQVRVAATAFEVTVWPEDAECIDSFAWCVTVVYRGHAKWAVIRGGDGGPCLSADGELEYEPLPSSRDDEWLAAHRFGLAEALDLARAYAPKVTINGLTAVQALAAYQAKHAGPVS